jgi:hypothetical protein
MNEAPDPTTEGLSPFPPMRRYIGCITPGCDGKHRARGLCLRCYRREYHRLNAARSLELNRAWRARQKAGVQTGPGHPSRLSDGGSAAGRVARGSTLATESAPLPGAPAPARATPVADDGATTGKGQG